MLNVNQKKFINTNLVFENGHMDFVLAEHKFVLDNFKNTLIDTTLCEIFEFSTQNAEIPHKFVSINVFFKLSNTTVCVLITQNPCDRFRTQTFLECRVNVGEMIWMHKNICNYLIKSITKKKQSVF
jgi:hypothetical protein